MYGYKTGGNYPNHATTGLSCPTGYTATKISGTANLDGDLYVCSRKVSDTTTPAPTQFWDFGGMYGGGGTLTAGARQVNPYTGAASCPTGYTSTQVL